MHSQNTQPRVMKVEKAFPNSCTGMYAKESILTAAAKAAMTAVPKPKALRSLFTTCKDPIEVLAWTETFRHMERCCDACEHAANVIESIVMNNS